MAYDPQKDLLQDIAALRSIFHPPVKDSGQRYILQQLLKKKKLQQDSTSRDVDNSPLDGKP